MNGLNTDSMQQTLDTSSLSDSDDDDVYTTCSSYKESDNNETDADTSEVLSSYSSESGDSDNQTVWDMNIEQHAGDNHSDSTLKEGNSSDTDSWHTEYDGDDTDSRYAVAVGQHHRQTDAYGPGMEQAKSDVSDNEHAKADSKAVITEYGTSYR